MRQFELYIAAQADVSETDASADPCRLRQRPARAAMTIHLNVTPKEWGGDWLADHRTSTARVGGRYPSVVDRGGACRAKCRPCSIFRSGRIRRNSAPLGLATYRSLSSMRLTWKGRVSRASHPTSRLCADARITNKKWSERGRWLDIAQVSTDAFLRALVHSTLKDRHEDLNSRCRHRLCLVGVTRLSAGKARARQTCNEHGNGKAAFTGQARIGSTSDEDGHG